RSPHFSRKFVQSVNQQSRRHTPALQSASTCHGSEHRVELRAWGPSSAGADTTAADPAATNSFEHGPGSLVHGPAQQEITASAGGGRALRMSGKGDIDP